MNNKPENPPAFPRPYSIDNRYEHQTEPKFEQEGMDLRDYFAAKSMQVLLNSTYSLLGISNKRNLELSISGCAEEAYMIADAMLIEREKCEN